jgi:hypothetical protein
MASSNLDRLDAPACPFVGLDRDHRTRYTYPHPDHRCYAAGRARDADATRQSTWCLTWSYPQCERFRRLPVAEQQRHIVPVIHAFRAGDSLTRIAALYGLSIEEIRRANGLGPEDPIDEGTRLVVPLGGRGQPAEGG